MGLFNIFKKGKFKPFEFPEIDINGQKRLKIITVNLSGTTYEHDGCYPQYYLPKLKAGEQIFLSACEGNKYDKFAVKVLDKDGHYIGWLPAGTKDVFVRLVNNETVLAKFEGIRHFIKYDEDGEEDYDYDSPYVAKISYARYVRKK